MSLCSKHVCFFLHIVLHQRTKSWYDYVERMMLRVRGGRYERLPLKRSLKNTKKCSERKWRRSVPCFCWNELASSPIRIVAKQQGFACATIKIKVHLRSYPLQNECFYSIFSFLPFNEVQIERRYHIIYIYKYPNI